MLPDTVECIVIAWELYMLENVVYFSLGSPNVKHGADVKDMGCMNFLIRCRNCSTRVDLSIGIYYHVTTYERNGRVRILGECTAGRFSRVL
jgi:hypothetical protein